MNAEGKQKLRSAIKRCKRVHSCIVGVGIELASPKSVMPILSQKVRG